VKKFIPILVTGILASAGCATTTNVAPSQSNETSPAYSTSLLEGLVWEAIHGARLNRLPEGGLSAQEVCAQFNENNKRAEDYLHLRPLNAGEERDVKIPPLLADSPAIAMVMTGPGWRRWQVTIIAGPDGKPLVGVNPIH